MKLNRRGFLKGMSFATAPLVLPGCTALTFSSNEKIRIAVIGLGRISAEFEMPCVLKRPDLARIVAVCDLDSRRVDFAKEKLEKAYRAQGLAGYTVDTYHDYKEVCARKDIDAVMLCLPDFWHALVATTALARKYKTVMQVGSQQRSWNQFRGVCNAVREGVIGKVKRVEVGIGLDKAGGVAAAEPVPKTFDYATWLGPTDPTAPYNWTRCHSQDLKKISSRPGWIQLAPYGWGMITNWGAHHLDIARWGLGLVGPEGVSGTCEWMDLSGGKLWNVHTTYDLHYSFNNGTTDVHVCDKYQNGVKFIGENGDWLFCTRGAVKVTPSDPEPKITPGQLPAMAASKDSLLPKLTPMKGSAMQNHVDNWLEAVKAGDSKKTVTNALGGHLSTAMCSLGQMCMELGRGKKSYSLKWDPVKETTGDAAADALMKPFARDKFDLKVNLKEFGLDFDEVMKG